MEVLHGAWALLVKDLAHFQALVLGQRSPGDAAYQVDIGFDVVTLAELGIVSCFMAVAVAIVMHVVAPLLASMCGLKGDAASKFNVSLRELGFYSGSTALHLWLYAMQYDFVMPQHYGQLFAAWPNLRVAQEMRVTYYFELSWYIAGLMLLFMDFKRKDFVVMFVHHVATIFMIGLSWHVGGVLVGLVVIILHNISDVFLHLAKLCNYLQLENTANANLAAFGISFFVLRLVLFPYLIYTSVQNVPMFIDGTLTGWGFIMLLEMLLVPLHAYWFLIIVRLALRLVSGENQQGAVNAEYDGNQQDEPKKDK